MRENAIRFPDTFVWGAATSAYQVEGSPLADGAGPSNWHRFSHSPGRIEDGTTGDVACDHYRRFETDVDLMRDLGLNAYRFSVSWSRVMPDRTWRRQRRRARFLRPTRRCAPRARHRPRGHSLPLGPAGRARRPGRMAQSRHRRLVRRLRVGRRARTRRPGAALDDPQRAVGGERRRVSAWRSCAGPPQHLRGADRQPQPAPRARRGDAGDPRRLVGRGRARREHRAEVRRVRSPRRRHRPHGAPTPT